MTDYQKVEKLLNESGYRSFSKFAEQLGVNKQVFYDIKSGKCGISKDLARAILDKYPNIDTAWLYGSGENQEVLQVFSGDITVNGNHNTNIGHGQHNISGNNNYNLPVLVEMCEDGTEVIQCPECGTVIEVAETALMPLIPQEVMQKPDVDLGQYIKKNPEKLSMINLAEFFPGATKAVEVDTRAMEPEYKKGHFIVIEKLPDLSYARADGTAYVVDAMRPHSLLRYLTRERDGSYVLTAESDKKRPIYLRADEINGVWKIVGGFWRE